MRRRQESISEEAKEIAWKAQHRLHKRYMRLAAAGKNKRKITIAVAGAQAYLLKNTFHKELVETIRGVHAGKKAFSPDVSYEIATHATDDPLTPAEISVLRLIAAGKANKQIANQLKITEETVKSRVKCILSKLGADDRTQAAMIGLKRGIIDL